MTVMKQFGVLSYFLVISCAPTLILASIGDRSTVQSQCLQRRVQEHCRNETEFRRNQPIFQYLLRWSCLDECKYECMWETVEAFQEHELPIPQFHGKWPFVRMCGIQEPASALFSIFNLIPHVVLLRRFLREIPFHAPMYRVWTLYGLVSINTWLWSTIFHSRDNDFTERMDYFCAFAIVSYSLMAFFIRMFGSNHPKSLVAAGICICGFFWHIYNMAFVHFDYGYNMVVNISVGGLNSVCWLTWAFYHRNSGQPGMCNCVFSVLALNFSVLLELLDFAPIFWTFDSHALWHLSTSPVHFLWYDFVIADCKHLMKQEMQRNERKLA